MKEERLSTVLIRRFRRVAWASLASYAVLMSAVFAAASELVLRRSLEHSASLVESLLGSYPEVAGRSTGVMPSALAQKLVGMGDDVLITRTTTGAAGKQEVYFVSPDMPAQRLEGLPANATPADVRRALLDAIARQARWRYRVMHRAAGQYDIYVVASRGANLAGLLALTAAAALLLPLVALTAARSARTSVLRALGPLERVTEETRSIGPADLAVRVTAPTGRAEVTEVAESINRMLERVERAHRALQSFTADASHELRTPLTHLRAQVQWALVEGRTESELRNAAATMERTVDRMAKLVEALLLIARGESRQLVLAHAPFELTPVVDEVREITEAMAHGKDLVVKTNPFDSVWAVGDADRTRQVLLNLASNAVRYTARGSVTFTVHNENGRVGVSVADTGPGIASEQAHRIFDRFFRVDQSRSRDLGGTGLGLAIARLLAELQGGSITLESAPGAGSRFTLWLPAISEDGPR